MQCNTTFYNGLLWAYDGALELLKYTYHLVSWEFSGSYPKRLTAATNRNLFNCNHQGNINHQPD